MRHLPAFLQTHLWTSFAQENHNVSGSGLGLSITKRIITMLGGTIDVRSTVDAGTMVVKIRQKTEGRTVGLLLRTNLGDADSLPQAQGVAFAHQSVIRCLETWFGLRVLVNPPPGTTLDFAIVDEELVNTAEVGRSLPCIILTDGASSRESRRSPGDLSHSAWVRRPAAPGRLERAFTEIIDSQSGHEQNYREDDGPGGHIESMMKAYEDSKRRSSMSRTISHTGTIDSQNSGQDAPKSDGSPWSEAGTSPHTAPSTATPAISPPEPPSPRILVVDDNTINLKVLYRLLAKLNVSSKHIVMASNGLEAVAKYATSIQHDILAENAELREMGALPQPKASAAAAAAAAAAGQQPVPVPVPVPFDIVLMDLNMPVMDGFDATREIRALEQTKPALRPCMIAALTGLIGARERERAFNAGVDVFCTKPFTREEIRVLLKDWRRRVSDDFVMN
ncbi:unnamed protein product [Parascedosporium putredinis]|uniref:Response regulatory domain-containing protein n=1 Tax=Parascedosporium putredinis TaxID=1442378 RepID=A0A9P1MFN1_9PEZI|nr:unnamed protein product [Parascedosporium putredinis]CAI8002765.1 unnamed protein product [Parascedosporium putredinis]